MNTILKKEKLADSIWRFRIDAPRIAKKRRAGQFIILRPSADSERIPLTIANADSEKGWIEIIFQVVGRTTKILESCKEGDAVLDLAGPLGKPTHIENFGHCVCIGGGVGAAPLFPIVCALKDAGNQVTTILGGRTKELVLLENEMKAKSDSLFIATDDGSAGVKGFVSTVFNNLLENGTKFDAAFIIGPVIMMKVVSNLTTAQGIKSFASLNPIMIDGTGMCGGCRVTVHGQTRFACVEGPEFDASGIEWDELIRRLSSYKKFETESKQDHICKLGGSL